MNVTNNIGLDSKLSEQLAKGLNILLSDYQVFYMNVRGLHWNIKGDKFFDLHLRFEELYNDLLQKTDEIAERILTLGFTPYHAYSDFLSQSSIKEVKNMTGWHESVTHILESLRNLLERERELLLLAQESKDEGSISLLSDYIRQQEKQAWMYRAFMN